MEFYGVKMRGRERQMTACPTGHGTRTPSCSVNLDEQVWNCHGCGQGGDVYAAIMLMEKVGFVEAKAFGAKFPRATSGRGGGQMRGSMYGGGVRVVAPRTQRDNKGGKGKSGYIPAWRR